MENTQHQSRSKKTLAILLSIITNIENHVRDEYFSYYKYPRWELAQSDYSSRIGKFLNTLFSPPRILDEMEVLPSSVFLYFVSFISYLFQPFILISWAAILYLIIHSDLQLSVNNVTAWILILIFSFATIYTAIGAYWRYYEIAINNRLSVKTKLLVVVSVGVFILGFLSNIKPWWESAILGFSDTYFYAFLSDIYDNFWFYFVGFVFQTSPALILTGIFFARLIVFITVSIGRILQWLFRVQILQSRTNLSKFLNTPLDFIDSEKPTRFIEIDKKYLFAIKGWAYTERQIVQNKLIPATLGIALLGGFMSTSLGNNVVEFIKVAFIGTSSNLPVDISMGFWGTIFEMSKLASFAKIMLISIIIGILILPISELLNRSIVLDFIAEACVLAEGVNAIQENGVKPVPTEKTNWLLDLIVKFLSKF
ncbi:MAG: hypothetical protein CNIPEHKO_01266 [Anaerolineales bacterium]|nr:hypothetical protein [Anaerolineales bacterium]